MENTRNLLIRTGFTWEVLKEKKVTLLTMREKLMLPQQYEPFRERIEQGLIAIIVRELD